MKPITKRYPKDDFQVVWQPQLCIHSGICFRGLPAVFDPRRRPWVTPEAAAGDAIVAQVERCPSGALSIARADTSPEPAAPAAPAAEAAEVTRIEATPDGPLLVYGSLLVRDSAGACVLREGKTALCRCGGSSSKPFCDGTHARIGFKG